MIEFVAPAGRGGFANPSLGLIAPRRAVMTLGTFAPVLSGIPADAGDPFFRFHYSIVPFFPSLSHQERSAKRRQRLPLPVRGDGAGR